ncbi:MAG: 2OG-Fe(II) oxygenase [Acidobacteria bacterium]|nr:2OG-Fe(II) oxygenase [Acidobacteriota bacterium]
MTRGLAHPAEIVADGYALEPRVRLADEVVLPEPDATRLDASLAGLPALVGRWFGAALADWEGSCLLRYGPGGRYLPHRDVAGPGVVDQVVSRRRFTVVLFLNAAGDASGGGFAGGRLRILDEAGRLAAGEAVGQADRGQAGLVIEPEEGMLVAFPAGLLHEVEPVTSGVRDVLVSWLS